MLPLHENLIKRITIKPLFSPLFLFLFLLSHLSGVLPLYTDFTFTFCFTVYSNLLVLRDLRNQQHISTTIHSVLRNLFLGVLL